MVLGISATIGGLDTTAYGGACYPGERERGAAARQRIVSRQIFLPTVSFLLGFVSDPCLAASRKGKGRNNEAPLPWLFLYGSPQRA